MAWQKLERARFGGYWRCKALVPKQTRTARLKKFGLTDQSYQEMLDMQGSVCAICGGPPDTRWEILAVDHDHETDKVRGLLCSVCNTMLGRFEEKKTRILEYLGK